jgi:hypothetical protein
LRRRSIGGRMLIKVHSLLCGDRNITFQVAA